MIKRLCAALLVGALLTGCAGTSRQDMEQATRDFELPTIPEPGKATVYIVRPSGVGALIRFNVFVDVLDIDTLEAGFTRGAQHIHFNSGPAERTIFSVAENTAELTLNLKPDSIYFIRQDATMGFVMARNKLVLIDSVEGKYHVLKTKPGTFIRRNFP